MKVCLNCQNQFTSDESWHCSKCNQEPAIMDNLLSFAPELALASPNFPADGHRRLVELENRHFWFHGRNKIISWAFKKYFPNAKNFFEIGCGNGFVLSGLEAEASNVQFFASEINASGLTFAKERVKNVTFYQMDATNIPFQDHFDVIGAFDVIEHIEEDEVVLEQMFKAVHTAGGGIIITVPQHRFLWTATDEFSGHKRRYSLEELKSKVEKAGFRVLRTTSFVSFLLPLVFLARLEARTKSSSEYDPIKEFDISAPLNWFLGFVLWLELQFIRCGISFSLGSSLLLIAQRTAD